MRRPGAAGHGPGGGPPPPRAMDRLEEEINALLLPRDPNDDKNVIVEIRGRGRR